MPSFQAATAAETKRDRSSDSLAPTDASLYVRLIMDSRASTRRFTIVAGKGGVGKSTVSAALGLNAAKEGRRTIIAELGVRENVPHLFGRPDSGYRPTKIRENLFSINIRPGPALREYGLRKLRMERLYELVFENEAVKRLLQMIPGMNELLLLGKAFDLERETNADGSPTWDTVIVDSPATGHGISLLRLPDVILKVARAGPLADEARLMRRLLKDPRRTLIHLVTLAEEMPVQEALELSHEIETNLHIPRGTLFVNRVWPRGFSEGELARLQMPDTATAEESPLPGIVACLEAMTRRATMQRQYLSRLNVEAGMPIQEIPMLFTPDFGPEAIAQISELIANPQKD